MHLILFDIDGTLLQGKGTGRRALVQTFSELYGKNPRDYPALDDVHFAGNTDQAIFAEIAQVLGVTDQAVDGPGSEFEAAYVRNLRQSIAEASDNRVCPGVTELLEQLKPHPQITLGLLTGNTEAGARTKLEPHGLNRFFSFGGFGDDDRDRSVLARFAVERARKQTGKTSDPARTMVIGDTVNDVTAATANRFLSVGVLTGWADEETLEEAGADIVFPDLTPARGFSAWLNAHWALTPPLPMPPA